MKPMIFSEGFMRTTVNDQIMDTKKYKATYNGKNGKMIFQDNDKTYYVEADDKDLEKIFSDSRDIKIENELLKLKDSKHYTPNKKKTRKKRRKKKKKKKTKTKTKKKKRKTPTKKKTKKSLLDDDFMKTLMP